MTCLTGEIRASCKKTLPLRGFGCHIPAALSTAGQRQPSDAPVYRPQPPLGRPPSLPLLQGLGGRQGAPSRCSTRASRTGGGSTRRGPSAAEGPQGCSTQLFGSSPAVINADWERQYGCWRGAAVKKEKAGPAKRRGRLGENRHFGVGATHTPCPSWARRVESEPWCR